ncbi:hypothetical protein LTR36_007631 [Oleoguttula mirabilis]|uniref:Rhodopsin domain-containing protein n=1 Tax=Oleoguttula mirabilis TaxID=1507867 RepID=A0AAV9JUG1_9PEZI|nr:hypothetical protein LTR36_007631 [Oleoguttula mirabilis]
MLPSLPLPSGQYPPFASVTDTDHRAWIFTATALGLSMTLLSSAVRISIRLTISSGWGLDDATLAISTILSFVQSSLVLAACADGLGKSIELIPLELRGGIQQKYYTSNLIFIVALGFSKVSLLLFLRRLTPVSLQRRVILALLGLIAAWTMGSVLAAALQCELSQPWIIVGQKCSGWFLRWEILEIFASLIEVAICLMAVWLVWNLHTGLDKKVVVVLAFSFRLVLIVFTGFRLGSFNEKAFTADFMLHEASYICWTQAELNYSILSATIPIARQFVSSLGTHYGGGHGLSSDGNGYGSGAAYSYKRSGGTKQGSNFQMSVLKSSGRRKSGSANPTDGVLYAETTDDGVYSYGIEGSTHPIKGNMTNSRGAGLTKSHNADATSVGSNDSQKMIIRKDVTWQIRRDSVDL